MLLPELLEELTLTFRMEPLLKVRGPILREVCCLADVSASRLEGAIVYLAFALFLLNLFAFADRLPVTKLRISSKLRIAYVHF